jgi:hypothetical protein
LERQLRTLEGRNQQLQEENRRLEERLDGSPEQRAAQASGRANGRANGRATGAAPIVVDPLSVNTDGLFRAFKTRLLAEAKTDPVLLRILATRPRLEVEVEETIITPKGDSLLARLALLIVEGFFADPGKTGAQAQQELGRRGRDPGPSNMKRELQTLAEYGFLTIEEGKDERSRTRTLYVDTGAHDRIDVDRKAVRR